MTKLYSSNIPLLIRSYKDIIQSDRDSDRNGIKTSGYCQRFTLKFFDGSYLYITEFLKDGLIEKYHYDWHDSNKKVKMKFHSEPHDQDECKTETEPYHIHVLDKLGIEVRRPNRKYQDLDSVLNFIQYSMLL